MDVKKEIYVEECLRKCRCCLDDKDLKNLWDVHIFDGDQEIYGLMLSECFALPWQPSEEVEFICELCVSRLREAVHFKQEILATEEVLANEMSMNVKQEQGAEDMETIVEYIAQGDFEYDHCVDEDAVRGRLKEEPQAAQSEVSTIAQNIPVEEEYEQIEYLDMEDASQERQTKVHFNIEESSQSSSLPEENSETSKRKWPKKKKKSERTTQYKQYTQEDLNKAIQAVRSGEMSSSEASYVYGVPKKTLTVKVKPDNCKKEVKERDTNTNKFFKLIDEIKIILEYTTAIPFKTKTTRYYCFYCSTEGPTFEEPDDLRKHTRSKHEHERTKIELYMRPQFQNEIVKLDVDDLHCTVCDMLLPDWNHVFVHFAEEHNFEFDLAYTKAIPYALEANLKCVLCRQTFHNFGQLDSHMNSHYSNYICYECGDTFLTVSRLDKHLNVHKVGNYPCDKCDKVFTLQKYLSKHISLVHKQESKIKCLYCTETFIGEFQRHIHVTEKHKEKVKVMTCEYCGNCYNWKPYFLAHMRRRHGNEKNHICKVCNKGFLMKYELRNHMVRHTHEKNYLCGLCGESFTRIINLKKHYQTHLDVTTTKS